MDPCSEQARQLSAWLQRGDDRFVLARDGHAWAVDCIQADCEGNLTRLIEAGVDLEHQDSLDRTLLNWACQLGSERCVRRLLALGADPHGGKYHSIMMAIGAQQDSIACILLEHLAPRSRAEEYRWASEAISRGCTRTLAWFIEQGYPLNHTRAGHSTLLEWAARTAAPDMLQQLLDAGADLDLPGYRGRTPLMSAIEMGKTANAHWLLDHGADPAKRTPAGGPLDMLGSGLGRDDPTLTRRLQTGGPAAASEPSSVRAAAQGGQVENLRQLLQHATELDVADAQGETALHKACRRCSEGCVALLLQHGASAEVRNQHGETPMVLLWQVHSDRTGCLRRLLEHGADPRAMRHTIDPPCFVSQLAAAHGEPDLVAALQEQAESHFALSQDPVDWPAHHSAAELVAALLRPDPSAVRAWIEANELLPERFAQALQADPCRVMFRAIELDAQPVVELLLDGGVSMETGDGDNNTALNIAARHDRLGIARRLIERGANVNAQTERGRTPIQFATSDAMRALLKRHGG